jgi:hypothetical protein
MSDTSATTPATAPVAPETWEQEVWAKLTEAEQWAVSDLKELGIVITQDIWPVLKSALALLFSQLGTATLSAAVGTIADPALLPSAVGSALLLTMQQNGVADATQALTAAAAAVKADPTVQALIAPAQQASGGPA